MWRMMWQALSVRPYFAAAVFTDSWGTGSSGTDKEIVFDASSDPGRGGY